MICSKVLNENVLTRIFCVLNTFVFLILFCYSMRLSGINKQDLGDEHIYFVPDSLAKNIMWVCIFLLGMCILYKKIERFGKVQMDVLAGGVAFLATIFSIYWVGAANIKPVMDQGILCWTAESFNNGEFVGLARGGYVGAYRHQLGMITLIRIVFYIFGNGNYKAFQYFSAFMVPIIILSGYQITKKITDRERMAELCYLVFMATCVPMYMYVPFVYGELCSTAFIMLAAVLLLKCMEHFTWLRLILLGVVTGVAVQMRLNTIIIVIGFWIVIAVKCCSKISWRLISLAISMMLGIILFQGIITGLYKNVISEDSEPMPAILWIAMGTNDTGEYAGWWDGYIERTFYENDYDPDAASDVAKRDLVLFMQTCKDDPGYALNFYSRKINAQWNAPMYQSLAMNASAAGKQAELAERIYYGELRNSLETDMNIYQLLLYMGILAVSVMGVVKVRGIQSYILLIGVFGGFLFSVIWEAKTRYVFPYLLMLIPYAAMGLSNISLMFVRLSVRLKEAMKVSA